MDYNDIINQILNQNRSSITRKISQSDINSIEIKNVSLREEKIKSYRLQGEYGEKKFIKP
jgi:hypothetical protein